MFKERWPLCGYLKPQAQEELDLAMAVSDESRMKYSRLHFTPEEKRFLGRDRSCLDCF